MMSSSIVALRASAWRKRPWVNGYVCSGVAMLYTMRYLQLGFLWWKTELIPMEKRQHKYKQLVLLTKQGYEIHGQGFHTWNWENQGRFHSSFVPAQLLMIRGCTTDNSLLRVGMLNTWFNAGVVLEHICPVLLSQWAVLKSAVGQSAGDRVVLRSWWKWAF